MKHRYVTWRSFVLAVVSILVAIKTFVTGFIGSWTVHEMQARGALARAIGVLFLLMGLLAGYDWIKKLKEDRASSSPDNK